MGIGTTLGRGHGLVAALVEKVVLDATGAMLAGGYLSTEQELDVPLGLLSCQAVCGQLGRATISLSPLNGMEGAELLSFQWGQPSSCSNQGHAWLGKKGLFYFIFCFIFRASPSSAQGFSLAFHSLLRYGCNPRKKGF